jgi:hypothetical protein
LKGPCGGFITPPGSISIAPHVGLDELNIECELIAVKVADSLARSQFYLLAVHIEARISQDEKNGMDLQLVGIFLLVYFRKFEAVGMDMSRYPMWCQILNKTRLRTAVLKTIVEEGC